MNPMMDGQDHSSRSSLTVMAVLLALLLMGAGVGGFMWRQVRLINLQLVQAKQVVADYQTNLLPRIKVFIASLEGFAKSNPDFAPILARYKQVYAQTITPPAAPVAPKK
jgi:hypothetical protein